MSRRELVKQISILLLGIIVFPQSVVKKVESALVKTGKVFGKIKGKKGNHIIGAKISLTNVKTKNFFLTETDLKGEFILDNINNGEYLLIVEVPNYKTRIKRIIKIKHNIPRFEEIMFPDYSEEVLDKALQQQEQANLLIEIISLKTFCLLKPLETDVNKENSFENLEIITKNLEKDLVVVILGKQINSVDDIERKNLVKKINSLLDKFGFKKIIFQQAYAFSFEIIPADFYN